MPEHVRTGAASPTFLSINLDGHLSFNDPITGLKKKMASRRPCLQALDAKSYGTIKTAYINRVHEGPFRLWRRCLRILLRPIGQKDRSGAEQVRPPDHRQHTPDETVTLLAKPDLVTMTEPEKQLAGFEYQRV